MLDAYEVHTIMNGEDLGVLMFENGELAVYPTAKLAQKVADGMNKLYTYIKYVVVEKEANK